jgi:3',5'-cyclic AMP phosphodiesterase CpdA
VYVLAHLSDPHLAPLPRPRWSELVGKRATGYLHWLRRRSLVHRSDVLARITADLQMQWPDHVAVTGDLVNIALAAEFAPARAFLEKLGSVRDVTLVPGNHDAYVRAAAHDLERYWGEYMRGDDGGAFPFVRRRRPLALIGLSSAVPTAPFMATGRLGAEQIARLTELLERCGQERLFRVVLVHHPPLSQRSWRFRLSDGGALVAALLRHGAELVVHGHDHAHALSFLDRGERRIPVVGVPSASEAPPGEHDPAAYNLYCIDGEAGAWRCELVSRGLGADGSRVVELRRAMLLG